METRENQNNKKRVVILDSLVPENNVREEEMLFCSVSDRGREEGNEGIRGNSEQV